MKVSILMFVLYTIHCISCLKSQDLCYKKHVCKDGFCGFSACKGKYSYDCNRDECSTNKATCNEYNEIFMKIGSRKNMKVSSSQAKVSNLPFSKKLLKEFSNLQRKIKLCPRQL
jgi:hypothetical protein